MIMFSSISPDYEKNLKDELYGCFKYIGIPFDILNKMPIRDRKFYIAKHNGIIEDVDDAAIQMLAYNYSTFIKASKIVEKDGLTVTSDRGNIAEHPAVKIGRDAQT